MKNISTKCKIRVAAVMDDFSHTSFSLECDLLSIQPDNYLWQLDSFVPNLLFVESAWRGQDEGWRDKLTKDLRTILDCVFFCRERGIPTLFWNKEDPVHFATFLSLARHFDHVFTTDVDCIPRYKKLLGHDRVHLLPFAVQPLHCNPLGTIDRKHAFSFAGSWYLRYPARQRDFAQLIQAVAPLGRVEIFDRNQDNPKLETTFPDEYRQLIVGKLPFEQINIAYKGCTFGLNVNTVKRSQSMFARRVFELMASNTLVVSNESTGMRLMFGDLVLASDSAELLQEKIRPLWLDETRYRRHRLMGLRAVLREHTYAHRLSYVQARLEDRSWKPEQPEILVLAVADSPDAELHIVANVARQRYPTLLVLLLRRYGGADEILPLKSGVSITCYAALDNFLLSASKALREVPWFSCLVAEDFYGPDYLTDLVQARHYSTAAAFGKAAFHTARAGDCELQNDGQQYRPVSRLEARCSLLRTEALSESWLETCLAYPAIATVDMPNMLSIDEFQYCRDGAGLDPVKLLERIGDLPGLDTGLSLANDILPFAESLTADDYQPAVPGPDAMTVTPEQLLNWFGPEPHEHLSLELAGDELLMISRLAQEARAVIYAWPRFARADLNFVADNRLQLFADHDLPAIETVLDFQDAEKRKIGHTINPAGAALSVLLPDSCCFLRFALRLQGPGTVRIRALVLGEVVDQPVELVRKLPSSLQSEPARLSAAPVLLDGGAGYIAHGVQQAKAAYLAGDYDLAAAWYEQVIAARPELAHIYRFNLDLARRKAALARLT